jgi:lipopolysaccharide/colanic/teichoic acid biosynthesis glycosyltransferase
VKIYQHPRLFDQRTQDRPVRRNAIVAGLPWMAITDALGLFAALAIVGLLNGLETAADRSFVLTLLVISTLLSVLFSQVRTLETIMKGRRVAVIGVPILAAIIAGALQYVGEGRIALLELGLFTIVWTVALAALRVGHPVFRVPRNILVIGSPRFSEELEAARGTRVVRREEPPSRFNGYHIVAYDPTETYDPAWVRWMGHANMYGIKVLPAPLVIETLTGRVPYEMLDGRWAFEVLNGRSPYRVVKRVFDVIGVVITAPLSLLLASVVALVVYLDSGRPILYWQQRVGFGGKPFWMVKFRTMRTDAEANGSAFATLDDHRVTKTGRFLRQYRLDEIPQLWNVLRGEMSIIGPRPEQLGFAEQFSAEIPLYEHRSSVLPGITGWAQVNDGYAASVDETKSKLRHDFFYVKHCSAHLDLLIVWRTIRTILTGFGSR